MATISKRQNAERNPNVPLLSLTRREFCAAAKISPSTLDKLRKKGEGPCEHSGGISWEAALAWIKQRETMRLREILDDPTASPEYKKSAKRMLRERGCGDQQTEVAE
jgi:hypothetical protein